MEKIFGELEEKIMKVLWNNEQPMKPSEVKELLGETYAYTTIMTVLTRLYTKGILVRKQKGKAFFYKPKKSKESFVNPKLKAMFMNIINSYGDLAITQFIDTLKDIDPEELKKFKSSINDVKSNSK